MGGAEDKSSLMMPVLPYKTLFARASACKQALRNAFSELQFFRGEVVEPNALPVPSRILEYDTNFDNFENI